MSDDADFDPGGIVPSDLPLRPSCGCYLTVAEELYADLQYVVKTVRPTHSETQHFHYKVSIDADAHRDIRFPVVARVKFPKRGAK